jgi:hypothetical protein
MNSTNSTIDSTIVFVIQDQQTQEKYAVYDEEVMFEYVKNTLDTITNTPVTSDHYYTEIPSVLPSETDYIIIEQTGFRNWKLYKVITKDQGWVRSVFTRYTELVKEIVCEEVQFLEDFETKKRKFISQIKRLLEENDRLVDMENKKKKVYETYDALSTPFGKILANKYPRFNQVTKDKLHELYYDNHKKIDLEKLREYHKKLYGSDLDSKETFQKKYLGH